LAQLRELLDVDTGAEYATWLAQSKRR